jgi:NAD-dependent dihydropyrimidine dehydrogenase PreA subunit
MNEQIDIEEKGKKLEDIRKEAEEKACSVQKVLYFIDEFLAHLMCGKCYPCSLGTQEAKIRLIKIAQQLDTLSDSDIDTLQRIGVCMTTGSFCKKGKDTGRFITEQLGTSRDEFSAHLSGHCQKEECTMRTEYIINPDLCIKCGKCLEACKYNAIKGPEKKSHGALSFPFEIIQEKCTRCGECVKVCPTDAIDMITIGLDELVSTNEHIQTI